MMASEARPTQGLQAEGYAKDVDLVFEGGGLKGIGLVGAYSVLEEHGYAPQNMAGASAGAIVAALIAAGYTAAELREVICSLDLPSLEDPDDLSVALAVRMSMSIPIFFEPVSFKEPETGREHLLVDGGMLSNFPVWHFDSDEPLWPTIGVKFIEDDPRAPLGASRVRGDCSGLLTTRGAWSRR
jgi:predicted acylesterase/phospholipase RssA